MDTLLPSRIHSIKTTPVNRGSVEFATQLTGRVAEVAIDYGDGKLTQTPAAGERVPGGTVAVVRKSR